MGKRPVCIYCEGAVRKKLNNISYSGYCSSGCYKLHSKLCKDNQELINIPTAEHKLRKRLLMLAVEGDELSILHLRLGYGLKAIWDKKNQKEVRL